MDRRKFITAASITTISSLAGCIGGNNDDGDGNSANSDGTPTDSPSVIETSDGPAELAVYQAKWSGEEPVTVDNTGQVEFLIGNRGSEAGMFSGSLFAESKDSTVAEPLTGELSSVGEEVPSGETITVTSESITPGYAGRYEATVSDGNDDQLDIAEGATAQIEVRPHIGGSDETLPVTSDLRLSVNEVQFEAGIHYTASYQVIVFYSVDRTTLISSLSDQTLAVIHATVENTGSSSATLTRDLFRFGSADAVDTVAKLQDVNGSSLDGVTVNPGNQARGFLVFRLAKTAVSDASLQAFRDSPSAAADAVWEFDLAGTQFPTFELVSMDVPERFIDGEQTMQFTIENTGDATGTFRGEVEWREENRTQWERPSTNNEDLAAEIAPGETATVSRTGNYTGVDEAYDYRFNPFGSTFTINGSNS